MADTCTLTRFNLWLHEHGQTCRHISRDRVPIFGVPGLYWVCQRREGCANVRVRVLVTEGAG